MTRNFSGQQSEFEKLKKFSSEFQNKASLFVSAISNSPNKKAPIPCI